MATLLVTHTSHFVRTADGAVYARDPVTARPFWSRYLEVFEQVAVAARVRRADVVPTELPRADGDGVEFIDLPDYLGPAQYARCLWKLRACIRAAVPRYDACCLRVPCAIAGLVWKRLRASGRPFGVEVVGDPWDSLGPGAVRSWVRPLARRAAARELRRQCVTAAASAYVTRHTLQKRYPPASGTFTTHYSSVDLTDEAYVAAPRHTFGSPLKLVFVGTLEVLYKAPDVLLRALAASRDTGCTLRLVGDGRTRPELEALAASLDVTGRAAFLGRLSAGASVRNVLDDSDVFVLPSRQEGMPRAMLEAMARGLPCIGSTVGGIPELLASEDMVTPGDIEALARKIREFANDPARLKAASARNLEQAQDYRQSLLIQRRTAMYAAVRDACMQGAMHP